VANPILGIDTGGTFTDFALVVDGQVVVHKLLSTPDDPSRAAVDGAEAIGLPPQATVTHGTTVATNALLERKGARTALVTTVGFEDVIQIGRQARSRLYDLEYQPPEPLVPRDLRLGVDERIAADGAVVVALTPGTIDAIVDHLAGAEIDAVAISFLFSFLHPAHEAALRDAIAARIPSLYVTASSDLIPEFREFERTSTTLINSYVGPLLAGYLDRLRTLVGRPLRVMQSSGGSITVDLARREPVRAVLSGPAGGVIGATYVAGLAGHDRIVTFDMGGTSTDVALCPGRVQTSTNYAIDGLPIGVPVIDIATVGAGGGSIARVDAGGALRVGPESAGADPGPACYGRGEEPTVTDANLLLGRLLPNRFLDGRMTIDRARAQTALARVGSALGVSEREAALGVVRVANAVMERALRNVSLERGFDPREFTLVPFGGAGPQHACELAAALDIRTVLVPRHPGVLSAMGVAIADVSKEFSRTVMAAGPAAFGAVAHTADALDTQAIADLTAEGFRRGDIQLARSLDVRYAGQSFELPIDWSSDATYATIAAAFHEEHASRFGYADERASVQVVNVRLRATIAAQRPNAVFAAGQPHAAVAVSAAEAWFVDGPVQAQVYDRDALAPGATFDGPALVAQMDATTVVPPGWHANVDGYGNLLLTSASAAGLGGTS
jgi:N-methylhydantoinase A